MNEASAFDMNALDSRIRELVAYARERDGEDRTTLFRNLVDLFLTGKAPQKDPTRSQLLDVLEALVPHVEADSRRTVADLIANMSSPPLDLSLRLCRDRASLISNLLKKAAFDEDAILDLIQSTGREHHQILASREDLSANIWIALARAAPNAPPFDHQSTLALWSDDLGITRTAEAATGTNGATHVNVTPIRNDRPLRASTTGASRATGKPSIRIIKTDEDLMAERTHVPEFQNPEEETTTKDTNGTGVSRPAYEGTNTTQNIAPLEPSLQQFVNGPEGRPTLKDPGPGGWAWRSDRDGLISELSPKGIEFLGNGIEHNGTTVLDILGLNLKVGHPVARAFQRRSTIHDAPIFLASMEQLHQHWTLEATPFFSNCGGIFEGYEGVLTPVASLQEREPSLVSSEEEADALFLDEVTHTQASKVSAGNAFTQSVNSPTANAPIVSAVKTTPPPQSKTKAEAKSTITHENIATSALEDVISETLKPLTEALEGKKQPVKTPESKPAKNGSEDLNLAEIRATFDLLEEALGRLTVAGKNVGDMQVQLQSEIASACARTLRSLLPK